jgi:hypothetical protein
MAIGSGRIPSPGRIRGETHDPICTQVELHRAVAR